jgi:ribonuclease III family protein
VNLQEGEGANFLEHRGEWLTNRLTQISAIADSSTQIQQISPAALAYLGDAVYELFIRTYYLLPLKRSHAYHSQVVAQVRAESQAKILQQLQPFLTAVEQDIIRRGRNATTGKPRRLDADVYQKASSLETLFGYLYLTDLQRLMELLSHINYEEQ